MATLINGDGNPAVYAEQDADLLSGAITNNKTVILDVGEKFSADVLSSSVIEVHDGVILTKEGRRIQLDQNAVDLFEFPAGAQGVVSWYYIGYKLEIDEDSHQICSTFVQKMDSEADTIPEGSFRDGDQEVYISLYHVQQDTLGVLTPTLVLTENMTMIDVLDNLIGSASDLPDSTKTITKNIDQINSDLFSFESIFSFGNISKVNYAWINTIGNQMLEMKLTTDNLNDKLLIQYKYDGSLSFWVTNDNEQTWSNIWTINNRVKHVIFNASLAGGSATQIAINSVLPAESTPMSIYTPIQGVSQNDGTVRNFYIQKSDNTLRYAETVPAGTYYFDMVIYSA